MKKFILSAGLVAAGAVGLQLAHADGVDSKAWSVSASLRGFYDDNYSTASTKTGSYGVEFTPQLSYSVPLKQTEIGLRYTYGLYYYQERDELGQKPIDQSHQFDLWLDHAFNERWHGKITDTFAYGSDPALQSGSGSAQSTFRVNGDNIANNAALTLDTDWTRNFSTEAIYSIGFYDYQNSGSGTNDVVTPSTPTSRGASLAGTLNRIDNSFELNFDWVVATETTAFVGYTFDQVNYTADEPIAYSTTLEAKTGNPYYYSDSRDNRSHEVYLGIKHNLLANLYFSAQGGFQYNDTYNDPLSSSSFSPYVSFAANYTYLPGSYLQVGFNHQLNPTDVVTVNTNSASSEFGKITQNQESSTVYASLNHHITPKLLGTVIGQWQNSSFDGGQYADDTENDYSLGLNLNYSFTRHFSAEFGYNYDDLDSSVPGRGYTRNRVYIGVGAAY